MKRIALIIGHSRFRQGARNKKNGLTEYKYNKEFVKKLFDELLRIINFNFYCEIKIFYRKIGMTTLHRRLNKYEPDLAIEFHCNAFNKKASGSEIIIGKNVCDVDTKINLDDFNFNISEILNIKCRGLKFHTKKERGGKFLHNLNAELKFIAEPFFIDNDSDLEKALNNQDRLIDIFADFIKEFILMIR